MTELEHWLHVTDDPHWRVMYISDPGIPLEATVDAVLAGFPVNVTSVLEIGCGYGRLTKEVHNRIPGVLTFGLDISPAVLEAAEEYDPGTVFILGDRIPLSFVFDAVFSVCLMQHLPDVEKRAYIDQAFDALTPGGVLRVQFITGERDNYLDHWVAAESMIDWCSDYTSVEVEYGRVHPQWAWLTGVK